LRAHFTSDEEKRDVAQENVTKEALKKECQKEIEQDLEELRKKRTNLKKPAFSQTEEIRFTIELIKYLTAELANTKAELLLLKQQTKKPQEAHDAAAIP